MGLGPLHSPSSCVWPQKRAPRTPGLNQTAGCTLCTPRSEGKKRNAHFKFIVYFHRKIINLQSVYQIVVMKFHGFSMSFPCANFWGFNFLKKGNGANKWWGCHQKLDESTVFVKESMTLTSMGWFNLISIYNIYIM